MVEFDYSPDFQDDRLTMYNNAWTQSSHASRRWAVYGYPECTFASISICRVLVQAEQRCFLLVRCGWNRHCRSDFPKAAAMTTYMLCFAVKSTEPYTSSTNC